MAVKSVFKKKLYELEVEQPRFFRLVLEFSRID